MVIYSKISGNRKLDFKLITTIEEENRQLFVRKKAASPQAKKFLFLMLDNYEKLKQSLKPIELVKPRREDESLIFPYIEGKNLRDEFIGHYFNGDDEKAFGILLDFKNILNFLPSQKIDLRQNKVFKKIFGRPLKGLQDCVWGSFDLNLDNLIYHKGRLYLIDYEWVFDCPIPKNFLYFRTFFYSFLAVSELLRGKASSDTPLVELTPEIVVPKKIYDQEFPYFEEIQRLYDYETNFQMYVSSISWKKSKLKKPKNFDYNKKSNIFLKIREFEESLGESLEGKRELERQLESVYKSRSWRLTSPLRKIKDTVRGLKRL